MKLTTLILLLLIQTSVASATEAGLTNPGELKVLNWNVLYHTDTFVDDIKKHGRVIRGWVGITRPWHLLTTNSGSGNPHEATAEKGRRLMEVLVERLAPFLVDLAAELAGYVSRYGIEVEPKYAAIFESNRKGMGYPLTTIKQPIEDALSYNMHLLQTGRPELIP